MTADQRLRDWVFRLAEAHTVTKAVHCLVEEYSLPDQMLDHVQQVLEALSEDINEARPGMGSPLAVAD